MIKNKKTPYLILTLLIIGTLLLVSVGLSIWLITDNVEIKPEFDKDIIVEYLSSKETTYNGNIQLPLAEALNIDEDITEYRYKLVGEEKYQVVDRDDSDGTLSGPINAGDYLLEVVYVQYTYEDENGNKVDSTVTVSGIDFKIKPRSLTDENVSASFTDNNFYYSGSEIESIATSLNVKYKGKDLVKGTDYTVVFSETVEIGNDHTATITAVDNSNFIGSIEVKYNILPSSLEIILNDDIPTRTVTGVTYYEFEFGKYTSSNFPINDWFKVQTTGGTEIDNTTISYQYYRGTQATTYNNLDLSATTLDFGYYGFKIVANASGFSEVELAIKVYIEQLDISSAVVTISETPMFDGTQKTPAVDSIVCGVTTIELTEIEAGKISYSENIEAGDGTGKVNIVGTGNYKGTAVGSFSISTRPAMIDGVLSYTITTPTTISKTVFIEGADLNAYDSPTGSASINGFSLAGNVVAVNPTFPDGANATASVTVSYKFNPGLNKNGKRNVEPATVSSSISVTLYAVAYNASKTKYYGTVERSMSSGEVASGNYIWIVPNIYSTTGFYPTIRSTMTIPSGVQLGLAYDGSITGVDENAGFLNCQEAATNSSNKVYLCISEGVTVNNNGTILVGACVYASGSSVASATVIMNNGTINNTSTGKIYSHGFIKGSGIIVAEASSAVYELFAIYDWPGGTNAKSMNSAGIFPFQTFGFTNISCSLKLKKDAYLYAWCQINASDTWIMKEYLTITGSGGLFQIQQSAEDYIQIDVENTTNTTDFNGSYTISNRDRTLRNVISAYGNFKDNSITVTIASSYSISTSTTLAMPIGLMNIKIMRGKGTLSVNSYKFMPGSKIYIAPGAEAEIGANAHVIFYDENFIENYTHTSGGVVQSGCSYYYQNNHSAWYNKYNGTDELGSQAIIDGKLTVNGYVGGKIRTTSTTGVLYLAHDNASIKVLSSLTYEGGISGLLGGAKATSRTDTKTPSARLYTASGITESFRIISGGTYYSKQDANGEYGWYTNSIDIDYDLNGGTGTLPSSQLGITIDENGYTIKSTDIPNISLTREHYTFNGWSYDLAGNQLVAAGDKLYASTTLYAAWLPVPYYITYKNVYNTASDNVGETGFTENPNVNTTDGTGRTEYNVANDYLLSFKEPTLLDPNGKKLVFGGWYTNPACTEEYRVYSAEGFTGDKTLYAYWYPASTTTVTVIYDVEQDSSVTTIPAGLVSSSETVPIIGTTISFTPTNISAIINDDTNIDGYFGGWFFDAECSIPYSNNYDTFMSYVTGPDTGKTLRLYGKIMKKFSVSYAAAPRGFTYTSKPSDFFVAPGGTITLTTGSGSEETSEYIKTTYTFNGFKLTNDNSTYTQGTNAVVGTSYADNKIIITPNITISNLYKVSVSDSNGYIQNLSVSDGQWIAAGTTITFNIKKGWDLWLVSEYYKVSIASSNGSFTASNYTGSKSSVVACTFTFTGGGGVIITAFKA